MASAVRTGFACSPASDALRCDGNPPHRAARAVDNLQWRGDDYGAGRWELIQVAQAGQAKLAAAVHDVVVRERRVKGSGPAGVRPQPLPADAPKITLPGAKIGALSSPS